MSSNEEFSVPKIENTKDLEESHIDENNNATTITSDNGFPNLQDSKNLNEDNDIDDEKFSKDEEKLRDPIYKVIINALFGHYLHYSTFSVLHQSNFIVAGGKLF